MLDFLINECKMTSHSLKKFIFKEGVYGNLSPQQRKQIRENISAKKINTSTEKASSAENIHLAQVLSQSTQTDQTIPPKAVRTWVEKSSVTAKGRRASR